jgi:hypothetical protein
MQVEPMDCLSISCVPFCCTTCVKSSPSQGSKVVGASRRMLAWLEDVDIAREDVPDIEAVHAQKSPTTLLVGVVLPTLCNHSTNDSGRRRKACDIGPPCTS